MDEDLLENRRKSMLVMTKRIGFFNNRVPKGDGMKMILILSLLVKFSLTCLGPREVNEAWPAKHLISSLAGIFLTS